MAVPTVGGSLLAQRQVSEEEAAARAKRAIDQQKAAVGLARVTTVMSVSGNRITTINNHGQTEELVVDDNVRVWRGKYSTGLSQLQPGDHIMAHGRRDPSTGRLIVTDIMANWTSFTGSILSVSGSTFRVQVERPASIFTVVYTADTEFQASRAQDIVEGRKIDVAGLVRQDGSIQATTVTVRDKNGLPTQVGQGTRTLPRAR
jgi:hypothetical protein